MTEVETSSPKEVLTEDKTEESTEGSTDPTKEIDYEEMAKGLQKSIQGSREREKKLESQLSEKEADEKQRKLADMGETERYKSIAADETSKRGKLEIQLIVQQELAGKDLPKPIVDLITEAPWAIPAVSKALGDEYTWDEAIEAVREHLPTYIESLEVKAPTDEESEEESDKKVDSERFSGDSVVAKHIYTRKEVEEISKDPEVYEKHREKILEQMQRDGGSLPD